MTERDVNTIFIAAAVCAGVWAFCAWEKRPARREEAPAVPADVATAHDLGLRTRAPVKGGRVPGAASGHAETVTEKLNRMLDIDWVSFRAVVAECAADNPAETAAWAATTLSAGGDRTFALRQALWKWTARDPAGALAWAQTLASEQGRECALRAVFHAWASRAPEEALAGLGRLDDFETRSLAMAIVAHYWSEKDMNAAMKWALDLPEGSERTFALANVMRTLFLSDKNAAAEWVKKLPESRARTDALKAMAVLLGTEDPVSAAERFRERIPGGAGPDPFFQVLVAHWAAENPVEAAAWASQLQDEPAREQALATVAQASSASNSEASAALVASMPAGPKRQETIRKIALGWAVADIPAASEWAAALEDPAERAIAQDAIAQVDHTAVVPPVDGAVPAGTGDGTSGTADGASGAAPVGFSKELLSSPWWELVPLVEQLPDGLLRDGLIHKTAVEWGAQDPEAAAAWAAEQLPDGRQLDTVLRVIVWNWTLTNTPAAVAWATGREDPARREQAVLSSAMALARSEAPDPAVISGLIGTVTNTPASETRVKIIGNVAYQWARKAADIGVVTNWAWSLAEDQGRSNALAQIGKATVKK